MKKNYLFSLFTLLILQISWAQCVEPEIPTAVWAPSMICDGNSALISISGNKNDATQWSVYTGSCGGTFVGSTSGSSVIVTPTPPSTTYYIRGEGDCVTPGACVSVTINTTTREDASFSYGSPAYCVDSVDPTPTITGVAGGYFNSSVGLSINANTGTIDVSASIPNTYTVRYSSLGICDGTETASVTISALSTFTALSDLCIDAGVQTGLGGGTATGGVYSGAGVTDDGNGTTYSFDPAGAGVGTHTITYTNINGCTNSASDDVEVFTLPTVTFTAPMDLCIDAGVQAGLGGGTATGGVYSGTGVTDDGNGTTYSFDPAGAGVGTHTITYTFTNANGCTNAASDDVEVINVNNTISQVGVVLTANEAGATYQWYQCPSTLLTGETAQDFTPLTNGDYKVVVTSRGCVVESACITISTLGVDTFENEAKFSMYPNPSNDNVSIKSAISGNFEIVNLLGQTVKAFKINANIVTTLYVGNLSEGIYLVKAINSSKASSQKLIIKK